MSGAAAGRVYMFDPLKHLEPAQHHGNAAERTTEVEWNDEVGPCVAAAAATRALPLEVVRGSIRIAIGGEWRDYACGDAFTKFLPIRIPKSVQRQGVAPPALVGMVDEL
jgi:hypothetical protein